MRIKRLLAVGCLSFALTSSIALAAVPDQVKTEQPILGQVSGSENEKRPVTVLDVVLVVVGMATGLALPRQIQRWRRRRRRGDTDNPS